MAWQYLLKSGMALSMHEKSGMANATPAIPLPPPLEAWTRYLTIM